MEVRYVVVMVLKILISTPSLIFLYQICGTHGVALLGTPLTNKSSAPINSTETYYEYDISESQELNEKEQLRKKNAEKSESEEIPNPSPLVLPGYNLPENIFNRGKPFYVEKDPLTGQIDFSNKSPSLRLDDEVYDYVDEEPSANIYDKANIDRKDGSISGHHRPSDVNQLTPNFHDFLNLPVKYNPDKYVYPLISSSYASTKIQGSVNKFHNHKDYVLKTTTYKPTVSPTYYSTNPYFSKAQTVTVPTTIPTTTTKRPTTTKTYPEIVLTTKHTNLLNSGIAHPSFNEEFEDYYDLPTTTVKKTQNEIYLTTENVNKIYLTSKAPTTTTTRRIMSLFEQLFGDYDETVATLSPIKSTATTGYTTSTKSTPVSLFANLPINKNKNKYQYETKTEKPSYTTPSVTTVKASSISNSHGAHNVLTGSHMDLDYELEYEDKYEDSATAESKPTFNVIEDDLKIEPLHTNQTSSISSNDEIKTGQSNLTYSVIAQNATDYYSNYDYTELETTIVTTKPSKPNVFVVKETIATVKPSVSTTTIKPSISTTTKAETIRVTSLPLGENHITSSSHDPIGRDPIIVATQNLREKLNNEKVLPKPFTKPTAPLNPPSTSSIHIAHDQDTVSFVVGNQQNVDGGQYVATSLKESPYDSNPFRPLYGHQATYSNDNSVSYTIQAEPEATYQLSPPGQKFPELVGSAVTIQPLKNSEASLAIGVPLNSVKQKPGQVVDEKLEVDTSPNPPPQGGSKVVFPDTKESEFPDLVPPPIQPVKTVPLNNDILNFNSKPLYHQLPSDLTPPKEKDIIIPPPRPDYNRPVRPPWDPRPGHFHSGKPEYNRPPRPDIAYKRIDNLPNILPQFRPNVKKHGGPPNMFFQDNRLVRQPLLERPSNRPIGFFEKLQPPPPPFPPRQNLQLRNSLPQVSAPNQFMGETQLAEDRIINEDQRRPIQPQDHFGFYQTPPQIRIANRRNDDDAEVETLQMIQAKNADKIDKKDTEPSSAEVINVSAEDTIKDNTEKSIYKVYPVNTPPIKMDVTENDKKESVVIGTRAELPLPPSKINTDFLYDQNPLFVDQKDRNDAPILKPHPRPPTFPIKSDFPYPLERPDPSLNHPAVPETPSKNGNELDELPTSKYTEDHQFYSNNQWNSIGENAESRIVTGQKVHAPVSNQISATLKTYTEKPIAIAYTPTEPNYNADKYSMPNYGSPVIPEIRPESTDSNHGGSDKVFTVSAIMHTHPQKNGAVGTVEHVRRDSEELKNHKTEADEPSYPKLDFEAPFQASMNLDSSVNHGWSVVRDKNKTTTETAEATTMPYATTSEFDIENFKPQLEGGFKPIYTFPNDRESTDLRVSERQE